MDEVVRVSGLKELGEALIGFGQKLGARYLYRAAYKAAEVIEQDAISRAPVRTGTLKSNIAVFRKKSPDAYTVHYAVGVRKIRVSKKLKNLFRIVRKNSGVKRVDAKGDAYYWRFLETGTAKMPAQPYLRPAFESKKYEALGKFKVALGEGVEKLNAQAGR